MKKIGDKIEYERTGKDELTINIFPRPEKNKFNLFAIWLGGWTLSGLAAMYSIAFIEMPKSDRLFMLIFLAFWSYFEFKMLQALRWQRKGKEIIKFKEGQFKYVQEVGGRGTEEVCAVDELGEFKYQEKTEGGFLNEISKSIWFVGGEVIEYRTKTAVKRLGMKLPKTDAKKLAELMNKLLK